MKRKKRWSFTIWIYAGVVVKTEKGGKRRSNKEEAFFLFVFFFN